jgi:heme exporter protein D
MMDVLAMGGYGSYIWTCFGLTLAVMVITLVQAHSHHKQVYREIEQRLKAMEEVK